MAFDYLFSKEQAEAIKILVQKVSRIVAFQTGLGKSYTALASFEGIRRLDPYGNYRLLVCCTKTAVTTWDKEIPKHTDYSKFLCTADLQPEWYKKKNPELPDVVVAEYTALPKAYSFLSRFYEGGNVVAVTDECLGYKAPVLLDGSRIHIGRIVNKRLRGKVKSVNLENGEVVEDDIEHYYNNGDGRGKDWRKVTWVGGEAFLTSNHEVSIGGRLLPLFTQGKRFLADRVMRVIPEYAEQVLLGSLLGDSSIYEAEDKGKRISERRIKYREPKFRVELTQGATQKEYLDWKVSLVEILGGYWCRPRRKNGVDIIYKYGIYGGFEFKRFYNRDGRKKIITKEWLENMKPMAWAIWFMDDGSINGNSVVISCTNLEHEGVELVRSFLRERYGIESSEYSYLDPRAERIQYRIRMTVEGSDIFGEIISPWIIPECMRYKDIWGFEKEKVETSTVVEKCIPYAMEVSQEEITWEPKKGMNRFCLGVKKNHNFVLGGGLVVSNCHKLKNPDSRLTRMMTIVRDNSMCTWGLTATPMLNHLEDIYFLIDFIAPGALGGEKEFRKRYMKVKFKRVGCSKVPETVGYKNLDELSERIKKYVIHAYRPMDVRFYFLGVDLSEREELLYLRAAMGVLGEGQSNWAPRLHDLQYAADNVALEDRSPNRNYDFLGSKEGGALKLMRNLLSRNKAVIFYSCTKRQVFRIKTLLEMKGIGNRVMIITGDTSQKQRSRIADEFSLGDILLVTGAGGESLNLQISQDIIMYNLNFKVGEIIQVIGRIVRMDSTYDHMNIYVIQANGTIDEYKRLYFQANSDRIQRVIGNNSCIPQSVEVPSRNFIIQMRKELLWKKKRLKELEIAAQNAVAGDS